VWGSEKDKLTWFVGELKILTESEETILQNNDVLNCIFRKNRALAPHERSAVPLGTDHCPVG